MSWLMQRSSNLESGPWSHLCPCTVISLMNDWCHIPLHHFLSPVHWLFSGQSGLSITQIWTYHSRSWNLSMASHSLSIKSRLLYVAFFIYSSSYAFNLSSSSKSCQVPTAHTLQHRTCSLCSSMPCSYCSCFSSALDSHLTHPNVSFKTHLNHHSFHKAFNTLYVSEFEDFLSGPNL